MSENRCRKKDGTYRIADFLSDAELQSHLPQNPHSRCRFYLATGMATRAVPPKTQMLLPSRTEWSADTGYHRAQYWAEKSESGPRLVAAASCARKLTRSARKCRNPRAPS